MEQRRNVRSFQGWADESDVLKTCDTEGSLCVERFPSLLHSTPETFLACSHSLQAAGQQAINSLAAGVMEHRGAWPDAATEGSASFTSEQCLFYEKNVAYNWGAISKVKVFESISDTSVCIAHAVVVDIECLISTFYISFVLCRHLFIT